MNETRTLELPILPVKDMVVYPFVLMPISVGRPISIEAVKAASTSEDKEVAILAQKDGDADRLGREQLFGVGTRAVIKRMVRTGETIELIAHGVERLELVELTQTEGYLRGRFRPLPLPQSDSDEAEALQRELIALAVRFQNLAEPAHPVDFQQVASQVGEPMHLVYLLAMMAGMELERAQELLEANERLRALRIVYDHIQHELRILELRREIAGQAQTEMGKQQREYLLRQQLRAIQEELGESDAEGSVVAGLRKRFEEVDLPEDLRKEVEREIGRLENIPAASPEHQVARTWIELVLELPWNKTTEDNLDLPRARQVLEEDHYDLERIKERILEHLAVMKLNPQAQAPILCFVGPPGVGKTSLGQSIARAIGRKFERFSLGGMHDEAELRGHRRTYIGAMPGRIIQALRRAGVRNPVLMLDEVDKLGRDFRGDPSSALLEILDPAQNKDFRDNYLDLRFDLSKVFFILTANTLDTIPRPLLDRMEILRLSGYSEEEKAQIARRYLIERQRVQAGLSVEQFRIDDDTLRAIIRGYTREAGVRELERTLGRLARKVALAIAEEQPAPAITVDRLVEWLGPERFFSEEARKIAPPGVATGLAWTEAGGDVLFIEALLLPEGEGLTLTGQLGSVMQESARAARSWVLSRSDALGIEPGKAGIHIHVPAGAIPKDGPSAGVTMATAIASRYTGHTVRSDTAMTGEITLTGLVLPVGGIKEKVLAARRAGIRRVILPRQNEKDLVEVPAEVRGDIEFVLAERIEDVLAAAIPEVAERLAAAAAEPTAGASRAGSAAARGRSE